MAILTLRPKHQLTIPARVAEAAGLHVGDTVDITAEDGKVVIEKVDVRAAAPAEPTAQDWLAAAEFVGERDRELLYRLAQ